MTSHRFFVPCILLVAIIMSATGETICAQTIVTQDVIKIRENNVEYSVLVAIPQNQGGCYTEYFASPPPNPPYPSSPSQYCNNSGHKTKRSKAEFGHLHIHYSFPIEGTIVGTTTKKMITESNVRAYWDWWYATEAARRGNVTYFGECGNADATYNCWAYTFGYTDIWIQNPLPIYSDDYVSLTSPVAWGDVIPIGSHVITINDVTKNEFSTLVPGTDEKNQYSGIYWFYYSSSKGLSNSSYINYLRPR